jgi:hypothetical protein
MPNKYLQKVLPQLDSCMTYQLKMNQIEEILQDPEQVSPEEKAGLHP